MDRKPLPAPFPVGTRLRYLGAQAFYADPGMTQPLLKAGMVFTITETAPGYQGTGRVLPHDPAELDDDEDPPRDTTVDGRSVYVTGRGMKCAIFPADVGEWEVLEREQAVAL